MSGNCAHLEEDWELFALGGLDEAAEQAMASHLQSGCVACRRKYREAQAGVVSIAALAPLRQPSARVERELMKRIRQEGVSGRTQAWRVWWGWNWQVAAWAFAAVCLVVAGWFFWQQRELRAQLAAEGVAARSVGAEGVAAKHEDVPAARQTHSALPAAQAPAVEKQGPAEGWLNVPRSAPAADKQKLTELESEIAALRNDNAALTAARAGAEERERELQAQLNAAQARNEALARNLETAQKTAAEHASGAAASSGASQAEMAALERQLAESQAESRAELQRLGQVEARNAQIESLLRAGAMREINLRAVDPAAGKASARVLYSPRGGLLLVADALPKLEHEKCYQLWIIRKGAPAILSAGLLQTSDDGHGFLYAPPANDLAELTGVAITDEPKGGGGSARGHKLLFGAQ
jgi:hypothetical protein